jgi:hypothetical protein
MPHNMLSPEAWRALVVHLQSQGRATPNFSLAQKVTGIDRRTIAANWKRSINGYPAIEKVLRGEAFGPPPTPSPPAPRPVSMPAPTSAPTSTTPPVPAALAGAPLGPVGEPSPQVASTMGGALTPTPAVHPLDQIRAAAEAALCDEQKILEGQHGLSKGLLNITSSILVALYDSVPEITTKIKGRLVENPKEGIALLRELMEITEKIGKTHGRNVETQRAIAGVPTAHELIVRREGSGGGVNPDADDERIEQSRALKTLILAAARRMVRDEGYGGEEGGFIEVEVTPARAPEPVPAEEPAAAEQGGVAPPA